MREFKGRTAVITGGASGIGLAMANRFAEAGMNVVLADIEESALAKAVESFEMRQSPVLGCVTDTMRKDSVEALCESAKDRFGNIHVLCNNAGVVSGGARVPIWEVSQSDWDWLMGVNFNGVLYGVQAFIPHMLGHGEPAHVINTASVAAFMPASGSYGVSKHGVLVLSEDMHRDLAGTNVGVSVLCPGWVDTQIARAERNRPSSLKSAHNPDGAPLDVESALKSGRQPADIAAAVFDAIQAEQFYILPHYGWDKVAVGRAAAIVARGAPYELDIQALRDSADASEDL